MFEGSITALITPFHNGKVDEDAFAKHIEWQIEQGSDGLVPCGTTGESPTLTHDEHNRVIELCVEIVAKRVPVIAGTGSNATAEAVMMTEHAQEVGADAVLIASPYYNKPSQEGLFQHYKAIHDATDIPIILYNIPGRSVVDIEDRTIARLAELPRIIGNKDATGDLARPLSLQMALGGNKKEFIQLSGEDATAVEFNQNGGRGCISVTANIAPSMCAALQRAVKEGNIEDAFEIQQTLMPLHNALFIETSPTPVKYALSLMGKCTEEVRLPLVPPTDVTKEQVKAALTSLELI